MAVAARARSNSENSWRKRSAERMFEAVARIMRPVRGLRMRGVTCAALEMRVRLAVVSLIHRLVLLGFRSFPRAETLVFWLFADGL